MPDPVYVARSQVRKVAGVHRVADIATGASFEMGIHGAIKEHYNIDSPDLPLPVDYLVAATGG